MNCSLYKSISVPLRLCAADKAFCFRKQTEERNATVSLDSFYFLKENKRKDETMFRRHHGTIFK